MSQPALLHRRRESFRSQLEDLEERMTTLEEAVITQQAMVNKICDILAKERVTDGNGMDN